MSDIGFGGASGQMNGKWLIVEEHNSVPVDLHTMKPDLLSKP
jgi:hypothetical protein